jgi:hypothetical protein
MFAMDPVDWTMIAGHYFLSAGYVFSGMPK